MKQRTLNGGTAWPAIRRKRSPYVSYVLHITLPQPDAEGLGVDYRKGMRSASCNTLNIT